jgi:2-polyprenyl-3-methyl-5-hydroxy-6-metoxy-1,4-benzoquinol methylase
MVSSTRFWDKIAERYSKKPVPDEAVYQRKLEITRGYLSPESEVFEFGCGTGSTAIAHAPHVNHILAVDLSPNMIEVARDKAVRGGITNVDFEVSTIEHVDPPTESFDVVLGLSILHLLEDKEAAIAKAHRLLKPGGVFVTSTTCLGDTMAFFKLIGPIGRALGLMPMVQVFTVAELVAGITDAGFEIEDQWQPARGKAVFIVARRPDESQSTAETRTRRA